jgi:hypothetical protein
MCIIIYFKLGIKICPKPIKIYFIANYFNIRNKMCNMKDIFTYIGQLFGKLCNIIIPAYSLKGHVLKRIDAVIVIPYNNDLLE